MTVCVHVFVGVCVCVCDHEERLTANTLLMVIALLYGFDLLTTDVNPMLTSATP